MKSVLVVRPYRVVVSTHRGRVTWEMKTAMRNVNDRSPQSSTGSDSVCRSFRYWQTRATGMLRSAAICAPRGRSSLFGRLRIRRPTTVAVSNASCSLPCCQ